MTWSADPGETVNWGLLVSQLFLLPYLARASRSLSPYLSFCPSLALCWALDSATAASTTLALPTRRVLGCGKSRLATGYQGPLTSPCTEAYFRGNCCKLYRTLAHNSFGLLLTFHVFCHNYHYSYFVNNNNFYSFD